MLPLKEGLSDESSEARLVALVSNEGGRIDMTEPRPGMSKG